MVSHPPGATELKLLLATGALLLALECQVSILLAAARHLLAPDLRAGGGEPEPAAAPSFGKERTIMNIIVPLDGSARSRSALDVAETIVTGRGGQLVLLHAVWPGIPSDPVDVAIEDDVTRLSRKGLSVDAERRSTPRDEETGRIIVEAARDRASDLIVMTTHGRGGLGRWLYGSVAEQVIRAADMPILLVPDSLSPDWPDAYERCMLLALDQSELAARAVQPSVELAQALNAEIVLVQVLTPGRDGDPEDARQTLQAQDYLSGIAKRIGEQGVSARALVRHGEAGRSIASVAHELEVLAIGIGTHSSDTSQRSTLGSVAMGTVRRTDVPVLLA